MTFLVALLIAAVLRTGYACSNLLITKGASADGSVIMGYTADDTGLFGSLDLRPAADHAPGSVRQMWDWDDQMFLGTIPEVPHTLNVVGNVNEAGVIITETTFGGRADLDGHGEGNNVSYGDLIWTTLQRAHTAREAITIMDALTQAYGYESNGESYGVGDADEVWLMEMVSKGKYGRGSVWVASRIPEGYVGSTANQARTTTFNQADPDNVLFSKDVISFARSIGAFSGADVDFNFREAYDPLTFGGARFGEARVWSLFNPICGGCVAEYLDYAQGYNLTHNMPLFVPAARKLSLLDAVHLMRDHNENTWFDNTGNLRPDVGAGPGHSPYRFRPLTWEYNGSTYLNERTVGIQQSGWAFIAQSRGWLPKPIQAVTWFAPDDASTSPRVPVYGGATRIPAAFGSQVGQTPGGGVPYAPVADAFTMSLDSAFWLWNLVGNVAFSERYQDAYPMITQAVDVHQARMIADEAAMQKDFVALYAVDPAAAVELATTFGEREGQGMFAAWRDFWFMLFATFRDGGIMTASKGTQCANGNVVNCTAKLQPDVNEAGAVEDWRARIVAENPERYLVPAGATLDARKMAVLSGKRRVKAAKA